MEPDLVRVNIPNLPKSFDPMDHETCRYDLVTLASLVYQERQKTPHRKLHYLEIGSWAGSSALTVSMIPGVIIHCMDHWNGPDDPQARLKAIVATQTDGEAFETFKRNCGHKFNKTVFAYKGHSDQWREAWPNLNIPIDVLFIDGDHRYEQVKKDLDWTNHVRSGGLACGHDYESHEGVHQAVRERFIPDAHHRNIWVKRIA